MNQKVGCHGNDLEEDFYTKYSKKENDVEQEEVELFDDFLFKDNNSNNQDDLFQIKSIKEQEKRRQESIEEYMDQMEDFLNKKNSTKNIKNIENTRDINSINQNIEYYDNENTYVDNYFTNFEQKQKRENRVSDIIIYVFLLMVLLFSIYMIFGNN